MSVLQKPIKDEIRKIAEKYNIDPIKIEEIENAMWDFVRTEMSKGDRGDEGSFENIYLRYLGTFHARTKMIKHFKNDKQT